MKFDPLWMACPTCRAVFEAYPGDGCPTDGQPLVARAGLDAWPDDATLGRWVDGRYLIYDVLAVGGFGSVYLGWERDLQRRVAIKLIRPDRSHSAEARQRFFREARLIAQLRDPAVVRLFAFGQEDDGALFMVFELIEGATVAQLLARAGPMRPARVVAALRALLRALTEAHDQGVIHRDLKPENVMLSPSAHGGEQVRLLDFGVAKDLLSDDGVRTVTGKVLGTPQFMSPEQCRGLTVDARSDLYAVGVLAFAMLTAELPFEGRNVAQLLTAQMTRPPRPFPSHLGVPQPLTEVVMKALRRAPSERYQSAAEMARAVAAIQHVIAPAAPPEALTPVPSSPNLANTTVEELAGDTAPAITAPIRPIRDTE